MPLVPVRASAARPCPARPVLPASSRARRTPRDRAFSTRQRSVACGLVENRRSRGTGRPGAEGSRAGRGLLPRVRIRGVVHGSGDQATWGAMSGVDCVDACAIAAPGARSLSRAAAPARRSGERRARGEVRRPRPCDARRLRAGGALARAGAVGAISRPRARGRTHACGRCARARVRRCGAQSARLRRTPRCSSAAPRARDLPASTGRAHVHDAEDARPGAHRRRPRRHVG